MEVYEDFVGEARKILDCIIPAIVGALGTMRKIPESKIEEKEFP